MKQKAKKKFRKVQAPKIEAEKQGKKKAVIGRIFNLLGKTTNLIFLLLAAVIISFIWQNRIASPYLTSNRAVGGDYFNALTYAKFFAQHLPLPPKGWMPFWNEGIPVIGGYPTLFFYLITPLTHYFDVASSMELGSIIAILLFLIAAHFLFWEASRNHLLSLLFTGILIITPATYYALTAEGLIIANAMQWLLPLTLFLIIRYIKYQRRLLLVAASASTGIALLLHPAISILTIMAPALVFLLFSPAGDPKDSKQSQQLKIWKSPKWERIKYKSGQILTYILVSSAVGSIGLYTLLLQMFFSAGAGACDSAQCWGNYPAHLMWFSSFLVIPVLAYIPAAILALIIHRARFSEIMAPFLALAIPFGYALVAWMQLINNLSSAIFPRRIFWTITVLTLLFSAICFRYIGRASKKLAIFASSLLIVLLAILVPIHPEISDFSIEPHLKIPNSLPMGVDQYIVPKYQTLPKSDILPHWLPASDWNIRMESIRPDFFIWWNFATDMPSTRGYSNSPTQNHVDWLYYLQSSTLYKQEYDVPDQIRRNRAQFLLDWFGVKLIQQTGSSVSYDPLIVTDKNLIARSQQVRDWKYLMLDDRFTNPVVSASNSPRVLVVGGRYGYETFIRAISLVNLNSDVLIPIQGPDSIDKISDRGLEIADLVVVYEFSGTNWGKLQKYVESGGKLLIDIGSLKNIPANLPEIFGAKSLELYDNEIQWDLKKSSSAVTQDVQTNKFSPLIFEGKSWKIAAPPSQNFLQEWMKPLLTHKTMPVLSVGNLGQGTVALSGFNLPYHIVNYTNPEEAKLLKNLILELIPESDNSASFTAKRPKPTEITVSTQQARSLLFRENYHPGWKAEVNGKKTKILKSGLDFMYIPFPQETTSDTNHITLKFTGDLTTWSLFLLSGLSLFLTGLYILTSKPFQLIGRILRKKISKPLKTWWSRE